MGGAGALYHRIQDWEAVGPGVVAGITAVPPGAGAGSEADFGLTTGGSSRDVERRYEMLAIATGMRSSVVARQVHGTRIVEADSSSGRGSRVVGEADGLVTSARGVLLAVTAADCVPVFIVDLEGRGIALLHAGWRGAAGGMLEAGLSMLKARFGVVPADVTLYLGPSICGACYEVGVEVLRAFHRDAAGPAKLDLRAELAQEAVRSGVSAERVVRSQWCTRCGPVHLHSHRARGVQAGRMAAFLGLVPGRPRVAGPGAGGWELR